MINNTTRLTFIVGAKKQQTWFDGMLTLRVWYSWCQFIVFDLFVIHILSAELSGYNQLSDAKETYFAFA
ncbi:hypothetical protein [Serratia fonticola]|uniref:hypothetical protein n=1 Tax=Serratia fonticola TaxID=47917 RepID=UPI0021ADB373|nr:hypothetical protein [Serratia fonticola]